MGILSARRVALVIVLCALSPVAARGQISPGELAEPHAFMEGVKNCLKCHQLGAGPSAEKCMECHQEIANRVKRKKGYHHIVVNETKQACFACHGEHAGRGFRLVTWPDGRENFAHEKSGWELLGAHERVKCRDCHRAEFIQEDLSTYGDAVNAETTFLGLEGRCLGCHSDVHRGQLAADCTTCHGNDAWKPASGFAHDRTGYPLRGAHAGLRCALCHPSAKDPKDKKAWVLYSGIAHDNCSSCHKDAHGGRLGADCASCHRVTGWHEVRAAGFDHAKTKYPLEGRHRTVACDRCHGDQMRTASIRFETCTDCHTDAHLGQFTHRADRGRCESCHTVAGFVPATFTTADHEATFALAGAHLAISCVSCHEMTSIDGHAVRQFGQLETNCAGCHDDAHAGQFATAGAAVACDRCHEVSSWHAVDFDHDRDSTYRLEGQHRVAPCSGCHIRVSAKGQTFVRYKPIDPSCATCHAVSPKELN